MLKYLLILFSFSASLLFGQGHQPVFPGQSGPELLNLLEANYKPISPLNYGIARDTLFSKIYGQNQQLTGVYTGYTITLPPNVDPTTFAYMNGGPNGINTEHTFPRSKGAENGNPKADMHHLYPARIDVNQERGHKPFGEINDSQTDDWYYLGQHQSNPPSTNRDLYSESTDALFEPPEAHKGNVARAMFYFYAMYKSLADAADPQFFSSQKATLCDWHLLDPVDADEWNRTFLIAQYQDGRPNPFVLDCTLAARTFCPGQECVIIATDDPKEATSQLFDSYPNPFQGTATIHYEIKQAYHVKIFITNALGEKVQTLVDNRQMEGEYKVEVRDLQPGIWFYQIILEDNNKVKQLVGKMIGL